MKSDERLDYYLMVARLMAEADAQMGADAMDRGSRAYSADLMALRRAVQDAEEAAAKIAVGLAAKRITRPGREDEIEALPLRH